MNSYGGKVTRQLTRAQRVASFQLLNGGFVFSSALSMSSHASSNDLKCGGNVFSLDKEGLITATGLPRCVRVKRSPYLSLLMISPVLCFSCLAVTVPIVCPPSVYFNPLQTLHSHVSSKSCSGRFFVALLLRMTSKNTVPDGL